MSVATAPVESSAGTFLRAAGILRRHPDMSRVRLYHLAMIGEVKTRLLPGQVPQYRLEDVDRVMAERGAEA